MLGLGASMISAAAIDALHALLAAVKARSTFFENEVGATDTINEINSAGVLDTADILMIPSGYSSGKVHSLKGGTDADWDAVVDSDATYVNSSGSITQATSNVPRIDYSKALTQTTTSFGSLLIEKQSTNLFLNTETLSTQSVTTESRNYVVTFHGTGSITFSGTNTDTLNGTGANDRVFKVISCSAGTLTATVSGSVTKAQLEKSNYFSSYIPSGGTATTRSGDSIRNSGDTSIFNQNTGSLFIEWFHQELADTDGYFGVGVTTGITDGCWINWRPSIGRVSVVMKSNNSVTFAQNFTGHDFSDYNKVALSWNVDQLTIYLNGSELTHSDTSIAAFNTTPDALNFSFGSAGGAMANVKTAAYWQEQLTDQQLDDLTS